MVEEEQKKDIDFQGKVVSREIEEEMKTSYLDYSMSVIVGRALPDVRDGLKPVHRRILYAMYDLGMTHDKPFKKSARIVGECFVKDTLVPTKKGLFKIQDIKRGDLVYTQKGVKKVTELYEMPKKPLLKIELTNGLNNIATESQMFKVLNGEFRLEWKEASQLSVGDSIVLRGVFPKITSCVKLADQKILNENLAYLVGFFLSDGWIEKSTRRIGFYSVQKQIIEKLSKILKEEFDYSSKIEIKQKVGFKEGYQIRISKSEITGFLIKNFDIEGVYALNKKIPNQIFKSPERVIFSFISGLIDGDGSVHKNRNIIHYGSVSETLINQLQLLFHHMGIPCSRYSVLNLRQHRIKDRIVKSNYKFYSLEISGKNVSLIAGKLKLSDPQKSKNISLILKSLKKKSKFDNIPYASKFIFSELAKAHIGGGWFKDKDGKKFRLGIKYKNGCKIRYSKSLVNSSLGKNQIISLRIYKKLERIGSPLAGFLKDVLDNNVTFLKIKKIAKVMPENTYDLQVQDDHEFIANGMVVHNCLGKYHPHGDMAVYDSMVRMVQPFSLRYPLVDGQGNFGCFTADTEVKLTDGRDLSFKELIEEFEQGKRNFTFTVTDKGLVQIAEIKNPRLTRKNAEIMKVTLDNEKEIRCTLNHKFMLKDGGYKEAKDLDARESLMPLYLKLSAEEDAFKPSLRDYQLVYQPKTDNWIPSHNLADDWNLVNSVYAKSAGRIRHHADFNKLNNNPTNIKRISWGDHWKFHSDNASKKHEDEHYRKSIAEGRKKFWDNPANRQSYSERMSEKNVENWKKPFYRKKMSVFLSEVNKKYIEEHPEKREEFSKRATETLKRLWKDPVYKKTFHDKIVANNKKRQTNLTGKKKFLNICNYLKENNLSLIKENYEQVRKEVFRVKGFTSWDLGIAKYYENNSDLLLCEINKNHKVKKIEFLNEFADVYDLTIDETHNFALASGIFVHNSVDGDNAAAMRYSEARLAKLAEEMLEDLDKDTVDFVPNFDNSLKEPSVLPSKLPNLLINGSSGIAVGMATSIPPHNLSETVDALIQLIDNPDLTTTELMDFIKGPDFPTAGIIQGTNAIMQAYSTGRGKVLVKARTEIEETKTKTRIIVKEIPYMVNKAQLVESIADLIRDKVIQGISDIRDESDKKGMRIVFDLKGDANSDVVLNQLFKHTRLETTFGIIMLSLVNNVPKILTLRQMLSEFIHHRQVVVRRRTEYELLKAEERAHILEGLIKALNQIDLTIKLIKQSKSVQDAKLALISHLDISEVQSAAILDMKLQRLTSLEQNKIRDELKELLKLILFLKSVLASEQKILEIIKKELVELKEKYGDKRKTQIVEGESEDLELEDLIEEQEVVVTVSNAGYIKRQPLDVYKVQARGGKGVIGAGAKDEDFIEKIFVCSTHTTLLVFTSEGNVHSLKVYNIPEGSRIAKGKPIINLIEIPEGEFVTAYVPVDVFDDSHFLTLATEMGTIKKTPLIEFDKVRRGGIRAITLDEGDKLISAKLTTGDKDIIIATKNGLAIRFNEVDVRSIGRQGKGVRGIHLKDKDKAVAMEVVEETQSLLTVTENGYGKQTALEEYRTIGRGGVGVINIQCTDRNGSVVAVKEVAQEDEIIIMSKNGIVIRTRVSGVSSIGRNTQGVRLMKLEENDKVVAMAKVITEEADVEKSDSEVQEENA